MLAPNDSLAAEIFRPRTRVEADGTVQGYASLFGAVDGARDMVMAGAFAQTLKLRGLRRIPMLFQHDPAEPIGVWLELFEDHRGLFARGKLIPDVQRSREVLALVKAGALDGLSIGFRTVKGRVDPRSKIRKIDHLDLWEISIVTFPLLDGARISAVKDARLPAQPDLHERFFRRYPRISHARKRAEQEWRAFCGDAPPAEDAPTDVRRTPRLETVRTRRSASSRRDRIRGWISDSALAEMAARKLRFPAGRACRP